MKPYTYDTVIYTSSDHPIPVRRELMPRLPDYSIKPLFYLYDGKTSADANVYAGGSGFLLGVPFQQKTSDGLKSHVYAVTNAHVAKNFPVIRINKAEGDDSETLLNPDWKFHKTDDLAIAYLGVEIKQWDAVMIMYESIITVEIAATLNIGLGSDVFMPTRFVGREDDRINRPIARFGTIAAMDAQPAWNKSLQSYQDSIFVECRTIPGHSGSPIIAVLGGLAVLKPELFYLLGIAWCYFQEEYKVYSGENEYAVLKEKFLHVYGNSGIAGVVPAWKLISLIEDGDVMAFREENERRVVEEDRKRNKNRQGGAMPAAASERKPTEDPTEEEFFEALDKVIKPIKDDGQEANEA